MAHLRRRSFNVQIFSFETSNLRATAAFVSFTIGVVDCATSATWHLFQNSCLTKSPFSWIFIHRQLTNHLA